MISSRVYLMLPLRWSRLSPRRRCSPNIFSEAGQRLSRAEVYFEIGKLSYGKWSRLDSVVMSSHRDKSFLNGCTTMQQAFRKGIRDSERRTGVQKLRRTLCWYSLQVISRHQTGVHTECRLIISWKYILHLVTLMNGACEVYRDSFRNFGDATTSRWWNLSDEISARRCGQYPFNFRLSRTSVQSRSVCWVP